MTGAANTWTVGELADQFGVTVRTLHHYDAIGLLAPSARSTSGYRLYGDADVARLRAIVVYRRLGFSLAEIAVLLDEPDADAAEHLRRQHAIVRARIDRDHQLLAALERALEAEMNGIRLTKEEQRELFGGEFAEQLDDHRQEAEQLWGETDTWRQSRERTSSYGNEEWVRIRDEAHELQEQMLAAMQAGAPPSSERAMDAAESHRRHITRWFYDCPPQMHRGLGQMYVTDPRFAANHDKLAPGLAAYTCAAIAANADRQAPASG